ncbi:MAG: hypothetical protein M3Z26_17295 [Bacteroidota bacterium]|nr:hypothetical protein [Bacteroidota bacterium]
MNKIFILLLTIFIFISCNSKKNIPDVSSIKINLETERFEQDFFVMDTNKIEKSIKSLLQKYPEFLPDYIANILGLDMDSLLISGNAQHQAIRLFIHDYQAIKDSSDLQYKNFGKVTSEIKKGLQFVKYYFPQYPLPKSVITFIGPINSNFETSFGTQGDILTTHALGIGLTLHLGSNFSFYKTPEGEEQYPDYLANNFDAAHIPVNCMRNIIDDLYHDKSNGKALIEQMVERGRRMYLLTQLLPHTPDYICMGYTQKQMKDAYKNEAVVWDFFLNNDLLNNTDQNIIKTYIGESPKTQELGEDAPGNIGTFSGLQIVKRYMEKYPEAKLPDLMNAEPREIYDKAKYKPRS